MAAYDASFAIAAGYHANGIIEDLSAFYWLRHAGAEAEAEARLQAAEASFAKLTEQMARIRQQPAAPQTDEAA